MLKKKEETDKEILVGVVPELAQAVEDVETGCVLILLGESFRARSVQRERSRDDLACRLVRTHHDSSSGDLAVDELQP